MKLTRRNLFRRSAEVAGVAAGAVVAGAIPVKLLEAFEPAVVPTVVSSGTFTSGYMGYAVIDDDQYGIINRWIPAKYTLKDVVPREHISDFDRAYFNIRT